MLSDAFRLYVNDNVAFVRRLIIKSEATSYLINKRLKDLNYPLDENDPTTWKYYLNLSGEYHSTDTVMRVVSSDDKTEIDFTKANLALHPLTRADYDIGGRFYDTLVQRYPSQEYLIHCIANPVDINVAIAASNNTILFYDDRYLSPRETNVVRKLQKFIYNQDARWDVDNYISTDLFYAASYLAVLFSQLPMALINIRLGNIGTKYVDDFHLWSYLGDHYNLSRYRQQLTSEQALYLYRNMIDIRRNAGKEDTIAKLFEKLGKTSGLDLNKLELVQENTYQLANGQSRGQLIFTDFGSDEQIYSTDNVTSSAQTLRDTLERGLLNVKELELDTGILFNSLNKTTHTREPVGLYRADPNTNTGITNADIQDLLLNYWLFMAIAGFYQADVDIDIPSRTFIRMSVKDAIIFFIYAANRSNGRETDVVPELRVNRVFTSVAPTFADVRRNASDELIEDAFINDLISRLPSYGILNTLTEFTTKVAELSETMFSYEMEWLSSSNDLLMSAKRDVVNAFFVSDEMPLVGAPTTYDDWLNNMGFNKYDLSDRDYLAIANDILVKAAGINLDVGALTPNQQAVVEILDMLTSYNVSFTVGAGGGDALTLDDIQPLPTPADQSLTTSTFLPNGNRIDDDYGGGTNVRLIGEFEIGNYDIDFSIKDTGIKELDSGQVVTAGNKSKLSNTLYTNGNFITDVVVNHTIL